MDAIVRISERQGWVRHYFRWGILSPEKDFIIENLDGYRLDVVLAGELREDYEKSVRDGKQEAHQERIKESVKEALSLATIGREE